MLGFWQPGLGCFCSGELKSEDYEHTFISHLQTASVTELGTLDFVMKFKWGKKGEKRRDLLLGRQMKEGKMLKCAHLTS